MPTSRVYSSCFTLMHCRGQGNSSFWTPIPVELSQSCKIKVQTCLEDEHPTNRLLLDLINSLQITQSSLTSRHFYILSYVGSLFSKTNQLVKAILGTLGFTQVTRCQATLSLAFRNAFCFYPYFFSLDEHPILFIFLLIRICDEGPLSCSDKS